MWNSAIVLVPQHAEICSTNYVHDVTLYVTSTLKEERGKEYLIIILKKFKEDSGNIFLWIAYPYYKWWNKSRSLNNQASRICKVSVEVRDARTIVG